MEEILFISHRIPFPPDRGDKIRSHHLLKALAKAAPVHVATFADDDLDWAEEVELATLATSYCLVPRSKPLVLAGLQALATRQPVSLSAFHSGQLADYVRHVLATRPIGTIFVFSGQMGQYVPADFAGRLIVDFVDVDSAKFEAYAEKGSMFDRLVNSREARMLRSVEARLSARAAASLFVSSEELKLFLERLPSAVRPGARLRVLCNGIDAEHYDPVSVSPEPQMRLVPGPRLIFTGQMDYPPNIEAVIRATDRIMPIIRAAVPEASFHVVGRNPSEEVLARHGINGTHVWGRVEDVRTWLKAADLALVPLEIARGVQNKVLEAMAMALPVVASRAAATGISAIEGHHLMTGESDGEIADAAIDLLLRDRNALLIGMAARRFVTEKASWEGAMSTLAEVLAAAPAGSRHAA